MVLLLRDKMAKSELLAAFEAFQTHIDNQFEATNLALKNFMLSVDTRFTELQMPSSHFGSYQSSSLSSSIYSPHLKTSTEPTFNDLLKKLEIAITASVFSKSDIGMATPTEQIPKSDPISENPSFPFSEKLDDVECGAIVSTAPLPSPSLLRQPDSQLRLPEYESRCFFYPPWNITARHDKIEEYASIPTSRFPASAPSMCWKIGRLKPNLRNFYGEVMEWTEEPPGGTFGRSSRKFKFDIEFHTEDSPFPHDDYPESNTWLNKDGEKLFCFLPKVEESKSGKPIARQNLSNMIVESEMPMKLQTQAELLEDMKKPCFIRQEVWWSYEFYYQNHLLQIHLKDDKVSQVFILGVYDDEATVTPAILNRIYADCDNLMIEFASLMSFSLFLGPTEPCDCIRAFVEYLGVLLLYEDEETGNLHSIPCLNKDRSYSDFGLFSPTFPVFLFLALCSPSHTPFATTLAERLLSCVLVKGKNALVSLVILSLGLSHTIFKQILLCLLNCLRYTIKFFNPVAFFLHCISPFLSLQLVPIMVLSYGILEQPGLGVFDCAYILVKGLRAADNIKVVSAAILCIDSNPDASTMLGQYANSSAVIVFSFSSAILAFYLHVFVGLVVVGTKDCLISGHASIMVKDRAPTLGHPDLSVQHAAPHPVSVSAQNSNQKVSNFDKFGLRGPFSAVPITSNCVALVASALEMDLPDSLSEAFSSKSMALIPISHLDAYVVNPLVSLKSEPAVVGASPPPPINNPLCDNPFDDGLLQVVTTPDVAPLEYINTSTFTANSSQSYDKPQQGLQNAATEVGNILPPFRPPSFVNAQTGYHVAPDQSVSYRGLSPQTDQLAFQSSLPYLNAHPNGFQMQIGQHAGFPTQLGPLIALLVQHNALKNDPLQVSLLLYESRGNHHLEDKVVLKTWGDDTTLELNSPSMEPKHKRAQENVSPSP